MLRLTSSWSLTHLDSQNSCQNARSKRKWTCGPVNRASLVCFCSRVKTRIPWTDHFNQFTRDYKARIWTITSTASWTTFGMVSILGRPVSPDSRSLFMPHVVPLTTSFTLVRHPRSKSIPCYPRTTH
jgi:hypothetical protein